MITEIHIYDFDGTLVDSSHRYETLTDSNGEEKIDLQYWIDNEHKALNDSLLPLINKFKAVCEDSNKYAIIATARIWCHLSKRFAFINDIKPNGLVARRDRFDNRGGAKLKTAYVNRLLNLKQFSCVKLIHVYEDNYSYLIDMMDCYRLKGFEVVGHYIPSVQGH